MEFSVRLPSIGDAGGARPLAKVGPRSGRVSSRDGRVAATGCPARLKLMKFWPMLRRLPFIARGERDFEKHVKRR
jgi:hypothetical protein